MARWIQTQYSADDQINDNDVIQESWNHQDQYPRD